MMFIVSTINSDALECCIFGDLICFHVCESRQACLSHVSNKVLSAKRSHRAKIASNFHVSMNSVSSKEIMCLMSSMYTGISPPVKSINWIEKTQKEQGTKLEVTICKSNDESRC